MIFQIPEAQKSKELSLGVQSLRALIQNFGGCYKDYKIPRHYIKMLYGLQDTSTLYKAITRTTRYLDTITKTTRYLDSTQSNVRFSADHRNSVAISSWFLPCSVCVCVCVCVCVWPKTQLASRQPLKPGPLSLFLLHGKLRKILICMRQPKIKYTERRLNKNMYMYSACICTIVPLYFSAQHVQ